MNFLNRHFILFFFIAFIFKGCDDPKEETPQELEATIAYNSIDGVDPNLLSLDIYYDSKTDDDKPVIVWVHGGAWSIGRNKLLNSIQL